MRLRFRFLLRRSLDDFLRSQLRPNDGLGLDGLNSRFLGRWSRGLIGAKISIHFQHLRLELRVVRKGRPRVVGSGHAPFRDGVFGVCSGPRWPSALQSILAGAFASLFGPQLVNSSSFESPNSRSGKKVFKANVFSLFTFSLLANGKKVNSA